MMKQPMIKEHDMAAAEHLLESLADDLRRLGEKHDVPGTSVAVIVGDQVTEATYGVINSATGVKVTTDTVFMIQSITKIITATLIMQLIDESRLDLDETVRSVLPDFRTADADVSSRITIRQLLSHTGGFEGDLWAATTSGDDALQRFVEDLVSQTPQNSNPGEQFSYNNAGIGVLGRIVEVLRGSTYEDAVRRHLAEPLGITELAFTADQALAFRASIGHVRDGDSSPLRPTRNWAVMPLSNPAAGNQLALSARGLLAFARMHLADGHAPDGSVVLSEASARLMRERQVDHPAALGEPSGHGLGWWLDRGGLVEHGGGTTGIATMLRTSPRHGVAAVVLTNAGHGSALAEELLGPFFDDLEGIAPAVHTPVPSAPEATFDSTAYVGRYENRQGTYEITRDNDSRLSLRVTPRGDQLEMARRAGITLEGRAVELRHVRATRS